MVVAHTSTYIGFEQANYVFSDQAVDTLAVELDQEGVDAQKIELLRGTTFNNDVALKQKLGELFNKKELPIVSGPIINETIQGINAHLVLFGIFAFLAAFNLSIGPIMWVIFSEIFPNSVRSVALPVAALVQTISSWSIQQFFPWQLDNLGVASIFMLYAIIGAVGLVVMYFALPETKGKTIEDIEQEYAKA